VDDADYEWLSQWSWYASRRRNTWYAFRKESKPPYKTIAMHVQIIQPP